jgi:hypothetical protein
MSSYAENLAAIRAARTSRDTARNALYLEQIRYFNLQREQKKYEQNELQRNPAVQQKIAGINEQIADLQAQLNSVADQLRKIQATADQLKAKQAARDALAKDLAALQQQMDSLSQVDAGSKGTDRDAQRKSLMDRINADKQALAVLEEEIASLSRAIKESGGKQEKLARQKDQLERQIRGLQEERAGFLDEGQRSHPDETEQINASQQNIKETTAEVKKQSANVYAAIGSLFGEQGPQALIEQWDDDLPIALLPVRLETKYTTEAAGNQLKVRIYPDDIAVVTHEKLLTQDELKAGQALWRSLWEAMGDAIKKKAAWNLLEKQCGANRGVWVALQTKPENWSTAAGLASTDDLKFPVTDNTKPGSWTIAPHTRMLPDKFVLLGYRESNDIEFPVRQLVLSKVGNQVNDIVVLGPAPLEKGDTPSLKRDESQNEKQDKKQANRIQYGDDLKWMADFATAVQSGLGFVITDKDLKSGSIVDGFDYMIAIGLKLSCTDADGKKLLEDLLENHNYSKKGLSLIPQGTPTNNTEEQDSGYSKKTTLSDKTEFIEKGTYFFDPSNEWKIATDGQRLAEYLGIDYAALQLVPNSDLKEYVEAAAMNKALYASTMGYFLQSMLQEVMPDAAIGKLRDHFTRYVVGRGPIAAIRVGNQPYGIIPTSAFAKWKYPDAKMNREVRAFAESNAADMFPSQLYAFLRYCEGEWQKLVSGIPFIHNQGNAGASLMGVLGLNPTSVEFFQRVGYSLDYLNNMAAFTNGKYLKDVNNTKFEQTVVSLLLENFGYTGTNSDGSPKPVPLLLQLVFQHYHTQLDNANLIDGQPLSEDATIKPYDRTTGLNFIDWLLANSADSAKLESQDFGGTAVPTSLLYLLLRNSLLLETGMSLHAYLGKNGVDAKELIRSRKFMNISSTPSVSPWEIFRAPANKIVATGASDKPLFEFIHSSYFAGAAGKGIAENLDEFKWALGVLQGMPTAKLERAMTEHLDTLSYRLDAWQTSLFDVRLRSNRNVLSGNERTTGIYIGAYGYRENVKPSSTKRTRISEEVLPAYLREGNNNLYREANNGGYVHAPSLNHAAAAAILRCGYLTHADPANPEMLSVNLSSERVRRAKYLIEGIRNGQTLEVLLGYQFERGLHDWSTRPDNPVVLNHVIPLFREAFPIKKTKVPQAGNVTGPEEVVEDYHVTNGLTLSQVTSPYPYGITALQQLKPALTTDQINALAAEKENIANTLDALRDVMTSESAYQLAMGNFDRAAAVTKAISDSHMPPDVQVIDSSRGTDMAFTNRVCIHFKADLTNNPWPGIPMTERALTEPGLNKWVGDLMGKPDDIVCLVQAVDKDGIVLKKLGSNLEETVSLKDLLIQPIDFLYLVRKKTDQAGKSELEARIRHIFAQKYDLADDSIAKIEFSKPEQTAGSSKKTFAEILPFANYIKTIITGSRPLKARDYDSASKQVPVAEGNPDNIKVSELQGRVESTFGRLSALMADLNTLNEIAKLTKAEVDVNKLREKLKDVSGAGFVDAFPLSAVGFDKKQLEILTAQTDSVLSRFDAISKGYNEKLTQVKDAETSVEQKTSLLTEMIKGLLGADFIILPRFSFNDAAEITKVYSSRDDLLKYSKDTLNILLVVNEWLHGVSLVRPKMHGVEMMRMLNDAFNSPTLQLEPIQIPFRDKASWLAVEYPSGTQIDHDTISCICINPQGFEPSGDQCGLMIDDWIEVIPNKQEVTGISFNYNQPNSVPPQALLLAVTPEETGKWTWDNLVDSVLDTFDRAKRRAVEPDLLDQVDGISTLLPALLSEFTTSKNSISLDYSLNIEFVRKEVMNRL